MKTIRFEDQGQDFLEWDIDDAGMVVDSRPLLADVWFGTVVRDLHVGRQPLVVLRRSGDVVLLSYPVVEIRDVNPFRRAIGQTVDVAGRLQALERFDLAQCRAALEVPGLQRTVEKKLRSRIRKLEKEQDRE